MHDTGPPPTRSPPDDLLPSFCRCRTRGLGHGDSGLDRFPGVYTRRPDLHPSQDPTGPPGLQWGVPRNSLALPPVSESLGRDDRTSPPSPEVPTVPSRLSRRDVGGLPRSGRVSEIRRPDVSTLFYLHTTKSNDSNPMKQCRRHPLIMYSEPVFSTAPASLCGRYRCLPLS